MAEQKFIDKSKATLGAFFVPVIIALVYLLGMLIFD
jgi:hypothetical protein